MIFKPATPLTGVADFLVDDMPEPVLLQTHNFQLVASKQHYGSRCMYNFGREGQGGKCMSLFMKESKLKLTPWK
jgi:hypothetical protein